MKDIHCSFLLIDTKPHGLEVKLVFINLQIYMFMTLKSDTDLRYFKIFKL